MMIIIIVLELSMFTYDDVYILSMVLMIMIAMIDQCTEHPAKYMIRALFNNQINSSQELQYICLSIPTRFDWQPTASGI